MIYPIVVYGDPVLERPAEPVTEFNAELKKLVDDMFESMYAAHGVGLAAPQIGISKRIAVIDTTFKEDPNAKLVLVRDYLRERPDPERGWALAALTGELSFHAAKPAMIREAVESFKPNRVAVEALLALTLQLGRQPRDPVGV